MYIAAPEQNLTSLGLKPNVDACAAACDDTCHYFTFVYADSDANSSSGTCYVRTTPPGLLVSKAVYYKMIPTQDMAAQSVRGQSVASGWYIKWSTADEEAEQGLDVANPPSPSSSLLDCLAACDNDATCVLLYYDATSSIQCTLKTGGAAPLFRTAVHGVASNLFLAEDAVNGEYFAERYLLAIRVQKRYIISLSANIHTVLHNL
jgi:hypothetical protein